MSWTKNRPTAIAIVIATICCFIWGPTTTSIAALYSVPEIQTGAIIQPIPADQTRAVQLVLVSYGYTIKVDGVYGPQTVRAVKAWQMANGLEVDGIAGPITQGSLGLSPAVRVNPPASQYAPEWMSGCDEMSWYRQDAGLPEAFDAIGYRESRCDNGARPTNSVASRYRGWWSVGVMHINNKIYGPGAAACGIRTEADYYGNSPSQKKASACFAKVLYDYSGMQPWAL